MKRNLKILPLALAWSGLLVVQASGSEIVDATFTPVGSTFSTSLTTTFSGTQASVTGSVSCDSSSPCTGEVGTFSLTAYLTDPSNPVSVDINGSLSGSSDAEGVLSLTSPLSLTKPFTIPVGSFDDLLLSTDLPAIAPLVVDGSLNLSLAPDQTVALPLTFQVGTSAVPEPASAGLLTAGIAGLLIIRRRMRAKES
jgi:hypothetical protein